MSRSTRRADWYNRADLTWGQAFDAWKNDDSFYYHRDLE